MTGKMLAFSCIMYVIRLKRGVVPRVTLTP